MEASCQCGQLWVGVEGGAKPFTALCHCTDCQRRSGSPFGIIAYFSKDAVTIEGEAREFSRTTYSESHLTSGFCPLCGSTLYVRLSKNPNMIGVPVGAFADPGFPPPDIAAWELRRHEWVSLPDGIHRFERETDLK